MDDPKPVTKPSLREKIIASANWGMLAGFWVELPLLCTFFIKSHMGKVKIPNDWQKLNDWSLKLVLPATLLGVIYGWNQPKQEEAQLARKIARIDRQVNQGDGLDTAADNADSSSKSWVAAEQQRSASSVIAEPERQ